MKKSIVSAVLAAIVGVCTTGVTTSAMAGGNEPPECPMGKHAESHSGSGGVYWTCVSDNTHNGNGHTLVGIVPYGNNSYCSQQELWERLEAYYLYADGTRDPAGTIICLPNFGYEGYRWRLSLMR